MKSKNGHYILALANDGNLILHGPSGMLWSSNTAGKEDIQHVILQHDGNLVMYNGRQQPVWHSHTGGQARARVELLVQDDGNAVLYSDGIRAIWATHTPGGKKPEAIQIGQHLYRDQSLISKDSRHRLTLQDDGNLALYGPSGILWVSNTSEQADVQRISLESDGNLVMYDGKEQAVWASYTKRACASAKLSVQNDGNVVIYADDVPIWATHTVDSKKPYGIEQEQSLLVGQSLISRTSRCRLTLQDDGDLVLLGVHGILWASNTAGKGDVYRVVLKLNGALVMYSRDGQAVCFIHKGGRIQSRTRLTVNDDGNLIISSWKKILWSSRTGTL
jgi:hypothetical protein